MEKKQIILTNDFILKVNSSSAKLTILNNQNFTRKTSYWICRAMDKIEKLGQICNKERKKIIEKYAKRYSEDGQELEKDRKTIKRSWKKGDKISDGQGGLQLISGEQFNEEVEKLLEIEVLLEGITPILFDFKKEPKLTPAEYSILFPLIEITNFDESEKEKKNPKDD